MYQVILLQLLSAVSLAAPLDERQSGPSVTIKNGTVIGSSSSGVDSFKGIPYAQPPVGNLRLRPPQPITKSFGTVQATGARACPQQLGQVNTESVPENAIAELANSPYFQTASDAGEDCLTINVQRPSTADSTSKLPVLFWIFGGGFEIGATSLYDGQKIVQKSISLNEPIIYVSVNYRLSGFGFLAGKELADEHSTNLGLRDQRLGLQWTAENIAAFGGDPDKVTIWGESAGAISVMDHTIINGGDHTYKDKPLFRGAIMDSGSAIPADGASTSKPQGIFDTVAHEAGCGSSSDKLACLRNVDYNTFLNAVSSVPNIESYRSVDLSYVPRPDPGDNFFRVSPEVSINAGRFAKVPIINGNQEDEGTLFALQQRNITDNEDLIEYLSSYFPHSTNIKREITTLVSNYPDQPLLGQPAGSPFRTAMLNRLYPQFKRLAAVLGDLIFTLTRRVYLHGVAPQLPATWSYLATYFHGLPVLGTFHASDIIFAYGLAGDSGITDAIQTYYISFVNHLDPNVIEGPGIEWPQWSDADDATPQLLNFLSRGQQVIPDDFRLQAYQWLLTHQGALRV